jgi:hypothetical protein
MLVRNLRDKEVLDTTYIALVVVAFSAVSGTIFKNSCRDDEK